MSDHLRLKELKSLLGPAIEDLAKARQAYDRAFKKFYDLKQEYDTLDMALAEKDGRLKKLKYGQSGKKKEKGGEKLDLTAYFKSLSAGAQEEFIQKLLNSK